MRPPSRRVILRLCLASRHSSSDEKISIIRSMISKLLELMPPAKAMGRARTKQILKMLLPIILPTKRSDLFCFAAVIVVTSSGRDVPMATIVSEIMRSERPMALAIIEAELTTSWLPPTTPTRPRMTKMKDLLSEYFGESTSFFADLPRRFLRAIVMR